MNVTGLFGLLVGLLSFEVLNCHSMKRELICQKDGESFMEGTTYTSKTCVETCLCQDGGEVLCQPCLPKKPADQCNGWAHEFVKVSLTGNDNSKKCHCFKYECHKKSFKSMVKTLWHKLKSKFDSNDDEDDEAVANFEE